jgi:signal transduction histidine kinase/CheY-like chemotaxis protein
MTMPSQAPRPHWRTTPLAIFGVAVLILLAGIGIIFQSESAYQDNREQAVLAQARVLAESTAAALDFQDPVAAQQSVNYYRQLNLVRWIGVYDRSGRRVAGFSRSGQEVAATEQALSPPSANAMRVAVPVQSAGQRLGTVYYETDRDPVYRRLQRYLVLAALILMAALVVGALGMAQLQLRRANRQLADRAEALAQSNELLEEQMEERAKAEDELRQSHKMQALGQLTGGIAHDFNNLLTVIQGSADMLCKDSLPETKRKRFAQAIVQAAENAASLTSQLLAFARRQPLKPERLDVNALIREMEDLLGSTLGELVTVTVDLQASGCSVEVDKAQLQSAILNIASNARDAMESGGQLTIGTRDEEGGQTGRMIAIDISDTGHGMDAETLDRVFEPFFTTKVTGRGTGLGLSQVYGFASQSGGDVRAVSEPGRGTTMTLLLPCHQEADPVIVNSSGAADVTLQSSAAILVVEDNDEVGAFAENLLAELGHEVTRARSGEEALDLTRAKEFDIVFSDVVMPGMGGLKLAETLAVEKPDLPVVLATGYSQEISETGSGGRPVILKPYRLATLADALGEALRQKANRA